MRARLLSATDDPTIRRSRYTAGGDVTPYSPADSGFRRRPSVKSIWPREPKRSQRLPSRVQADKACINRGRIDAIVGHCHAATGEIAVVGVAANLQVRPPDLRPCVCIESNHQAARSRQIQPIVCVYGCRLERRPVGSGAKRFGRLTRVVGPPNGQSVDRVRADAIGPRLCRECEAEEAEAPPAMSLMRASTRRWQRRVRVPLRPSGCPGLATRSRPPAAGRC